MLERYKADHGDNPKAVSLFSSYSVDHIPPSIRELAETHTDIRFYVGYQELLSSDVSGLKNLYFGEVSDTGDGVSEGSSGTCWFTTQRGTVHFLDLVDRWNP